MQVLIFALRADVLFTGHLCHMESAHSLRTQIQIIQLSAWKIDGQMLASFPFCTNRNCSPLTIHK